MTVRRDAAARDAAGSPITTGRIRASARRRSPPARRSPGTPGSARPRPRRRRSASPSGGLVGVVLVGTTMPASASTASSTNTGISTRTASAIASEGRADTVVPSSKASSPKKVPSRKSTTRTWTDGAAEGGDHVAEQVVGERAGRPDALLMHGDRGRLGGADEDGQAARTIDLGQHQNRLLGGHLDPDADDAHLDHLGVPFSVTSKRYTSSAEPSGAGSAVPVGRTGAR